MSRPVVYTDATVEVKACPGVHIAAALLHAARIAKILGERVRLTFNEEGYVVKPDGSYENATLHGESEASMVLDEFTGYGDWTGYQL